MPSGSTPPPNRRRAQAIVTALPLRAEATIASVTATVLTISSGAIGEFHALRHRVGESLQLGAFLVDGVVGHALDVAFEIGSGELGLAADFQRAFRAENMDAPEPAGGVQRAEHAGDAAGKAQQAGGGVVDVDVVLQPLAERKHRRHRSGDMHHAVDHVHAARGHGAARAFRLVRAPIARLGLVARRPGELPLDVTQLCRSRRPRCGAPCRHRTARSAG